MSSTPSPSSTGAVISGESQPTSFKIVGVLLAVASGAFIGSSFVFKKKGLLASQAKAAAEGHAAGEGHAYLKSPMWWTGMTLMVIGEACNFVAYAFTEAILVTPLGALSVVISAILSSIFLKEKLTFFGKIGCALCIVGATIIALNGPDEQSVNTITQFQHLFLAPGFLVWGGLLILGSLILVFFAAPRWGKKNMLVYIMVCSLIGGISVSCTQGLGSSIITSIRGDNQFKHWFIYFLLAFVVVTLLTEINYLNKALELFNTAMVTPTYYVIFTFSTLVTSSILYQGFKASPEQIITVVLGFLTICAGITLLQLSKIDPATIESNLDRRSTLLVKAAKAEVDDGDDEEKALSMIEDPGVDSIRGGFGAIGSIHRAVSHKRRASQRRSSQASHDWGIPDGMPRYQLHDRPFPRESMSSNNRATVMSPGSLSPTRAGRSPTALSAPAANRDRSPSVHFSPQDRTHQYAPAGTKKGDNIAIHDLRDRPAMYREDSGAAGMSTGVQVTPPLARLDTAGFPPSEPSPGYTPDSHAQHATYREPFEPGGTLNPGSSGSPGNVSPNQFGAYGSKSATLPKRTPTLASLLASQFAASVPDLPGGQPPVPSPLLEGEEPSGNRSRAASHSSASSRPGHGIRLPSRNRATPDSIKKDERGSDDTEELLSGRRFSDADSEPDSDKKSPL